MGKVTVNEADGTMVMECPKCRSEIVIWQSKNESCGRAINLKCSNCLFEFKLSLECRRNLRRKTNLEGKYSDGKKMIVESLSYTGIGFKALEEESYQIRIGDIFAVEFMLDDEAASSIRALVSVKRNVEDSVGCEFVRFDGDSEKNLDTYLMLDF